jgi:hypothetical protein
MMRSVAVVVAAGLLACSTSRRQGDGPCTEGAQRCMGADLQECRGGAFTTTETCPSACDDQLGCVLCEPSTAVCLGSTSHLCTPDGMGYTDTECNHPGEDCNTMSGTCETPCSPEALANSYLGCEYYPTVTGNEVSNDYQFAVVVANYNHTTATVTLDGGGATAETILIGPRSVAIKMLPWQEQLKLCNAPLWEDCRFPAHLSATAQAFHLKADRPVAVYQFNPLNYTQPGEQEFSYTNDASLLFPINVWGTEYRVASWRESNGQPGLLTITANQDDTHVMVTTRGPTQGDGMTVPSFLADQPQMLTLTRGQVVELGAIAAGDLTGSAVTSDKPVQVIGGHYCANVPLGVSYCDHLEESMIPVQALANDYVVTSPASDTFPDGRVEVVRVIATAPNTELVFDPPQSGVNTTLQRAGDFVELNVGTNFEVSANAKILVAQYMEGQLATTGTADPAMTVTVPIGQFRSEYLFHAPINYVTNYVDIVTKAGTQITLDEAPVTSPQEPVGGGGWVLMRVTLDHGVAGDGNHHIVGTGPFGITVYGYGDYTSFWYPGGLDLAPILE